MPCFLYVLEAGHFCVVMGELQPFGGELLRIRYELQPFHVELLPIPSELHLSALVRLFFLNCEQVSVS